MYNFFYRSYDFRKFWTCFRGICFINWHSFDGDEALSAIIETDGYAYNISDKNMKKMGTYLKQHEGKNILPASTAGLIGLLNLNETEPLESDRYVAVLTAKN